MKEYPMMTSRAGGIKRGLKEHSIYELMEDMTRCGVIAQGQMIGHLFSKYMVGGVLEDTARKYRSGLVNTDRPGNINLSNEGPE